MQSHDTTTAIDRLDTFLNQRLLAATARADVAAWWERKIEAKRILQHLPPVALEGAAAEILERLRRAA